MTGERESDISDRLLATASREELYLLLNSVIPTEITDAYPLDSTQIVNEAVLFSSWCAQGLENDPFTLKQFASIACNTADDIEKVRLLLGFCIAGGILAEVTPGFFAMATCESLQQEIKLDEDRAHKLKISSSELKLRLRSLLETNNNGDRDANQAE